MAPNREDCIRAVAALVMSLQDAGAGAGDVVAALEAAARCEKRLREHVEIEAQALVDRITPDNLHPAVER